MKTRDGVEFVLGMTVYDQHGRKFVTSAEAYTLTSCGVDYAAYVAKDGKGYFMTSTVYSSQEARIKDQCATLEKLQRELAEELAWVRNGGNPRRSEFLFMREVKVS